MFADCATTAALSNDNNSLTVLSGFLSEPRQVREAGKDNYSHPTEKGETQEKGSDDSEE